MQSDTIILSVDYDPYQLQQMMDVCVWLLVGGYFGFLGQEAFLCMCGNELHNAKQFHLVTLFYDFFFTSNYK